MRFFSARRILLMGVLFVLIVGRSVGNIPPVEESGVISLVGDVEARSEVLVFPKVPGEIREIRVEVGDQVKKGDIIAVVDHIKLDLAVRQASAAHAAAEAALVKARALAEAKVMSDYAQAEAGVAAARIALEQVENLSKTQALSQAAQARAALEAIKATLRKAERGAREEEIKQAEAQLQQAEAALENARRNYDRMSKLFEADAISRQTFDGIEAQYRVAKSQYEAAKQFLRMVKSGSRQEDIDAVRAQVKQAEAALEAAERLEETRNWEKEIALAKAQVKRAEAARDLAKAAVDAQTWQQDIKQAEMNAEQARIALELAREQLSDAFIRAPISGVISLRNADVGDMASPTSPVFEVIDPSTVKIVANIVESDYHRIKPGMTAEISVDALPKPVRGEVTLVGPKFNKMTRTAVVEIRVDNAEGKLAPGMFAKIKIDLNQDRQLTLSGGK